MKHLPWLFFSFFTFAQAEPLSEGPSEKIPVKALVTEMPETLKGTFKSAFSKEAIPGWAWVVSTSALTYHYDADLYEGAQNTGHRWGLSTEDHTKTVVSVGPYDILRLPTDTTSTLYFLGDGWVHVGTAVAMFSYGWLGDHARPFNTGLQLLHGMTVSTIINQAIKRSTGRESPNKRTEERGRWRLFPSIKAYNENTAKYDAVPSGHIMTATLMFLVIRGNYPEYESVLMPVQWAWLTTLGFAMMVNGVHWASDYPLGIAIGYVVANHSLKLGGTKKSTTEKVASWSILPGVSEDGAQTLNWIYSF